MMRALGGTRCWRWSFAAPASAQDTGTYISAPLDWGTAAAWLDADADGKADYCRLSPDARLRCTLSVGNGFGGTIVSGVVDAGYPDARVWGDVDGDHRADYCRRVGGGAAGNRLSCTHSTGERLRHRRHDRPAGLGRGAGHRAGRRDRRRARRLLPPVGGPSAVHRVTAAPPFGGARSAPGRSTPAPPPAARWVDFDGDGKADFCRVLARRCGCSPSTGSRLRGDGHVLRARRRLRRGPRLGRRQRRRPRATTAAASAAAHQHARALHARDAGPASAQTVTSGRIEWGAEAAARRGSTSTATATATSAARSAPP